MKAQETALKKFAGLVQTTCASMGEHHLQRLLFHKREGVVAEGSTALYSIVVVEVEAAKLPLG